MDTELVTLASAGAGTLVTLMVTDGWAEVKERFAPLIARRHGDAEAVAAELEGSRTQLTAAQANGDHGAAAVVTEHWRSRLGQVLQGDPEAATLLNKLVSAYASDLRPVPGHSAIHHNKFLGPTVFNTGGGDQTINFGTASS